MKYLVHLDGALPNLALMRLATYFRARGEAVRLLLLAGLARRGRRDVDVLSGGASEKLATGAGYQGPLNAFALASVREHLDAGAVDAATRAEVLRRAAAHISRGLRGFEGERFDLGVFLSRRFRETAAKRNITFAQRRTRFVRDGAYGVWARAGKPATLHEDRDGRVLDAYRRQAAILDGYARSLVTELVPSA